MDEKHYVIVVGARPNFVKLAALMREAKNHPHIQFTVIHTGQHYDYEMSQMFFDDLGIPKPDILLSNDHLGMMIKNIRENIEKLGCACDGVIVFGDTRSALAGALAAKGLTRLIHIEAGLRSFDNRMPEETNRIVIDHLSDLLFTTEESADVNLKNEGLSGINVGNLMLETLQSNFDKLYGRFPMHIIATIHRSENMDNLKKIISLLKKIPHILLILHPNTRKEIESQNISLGGMEYTPALGYMDFMRLVINSYGVITDSGGIQEEVNYLGVPCATIRDNTERPSTLAGSNKLFSVDSRPEDILAHLDQKFKPLQVDTKVAEKIFKHL